MAYSKNTNGTYTDLPLTGFPASVDSWTDSVDISADTLALANQYKAALAAGNYAGAQTILNGDTSGQLKKAIVSAAQFNQFKQAVMAIERMWKEDIESYVINQAFTEQVFKLIGGTVISTGANLNSYTAIGNYYCSTDNVAASIANSPVAVKFCMKVSSANGDTQSGAARYIRQLFIPADVASGLEFVRYGSTANSGATWTFGAWAQYATSASVNKVVNDLTALSQTVSGISTNLTSEIARAKSAEGTKAATSDLTSGSIVVKSATNATNAVNATNADKVDGFHIGWDGTTLSLWA